MDISNIRQDYTRHSLRKADAGDDPIKFFDKWLSQAIELKVIEPPAMGLSTVSPDGQPSSRMVLLKGLEDEQLIFYSNYQSTKAAHIEANPKVALHFFWNELERQVRFEGIVSKLPASDSDEYFASRPFESKIGALASPQSRVIANREFIEQQYSRLHRKFLSTEIQRPEFWGGYSFKPHRVEFWQGRASRLHDRLQFRLDKGEWICERLAP